MEDIERKAAAVREKVFGEELARIENEASVRSQQMILEWRAEEEQIRQQEIKKAEEERRKAEQLLKDSEQGILKQLEGESTKKLEAILQSVADRKRRAEDDEKNLVKKAEVEARQRDVDKAERLKLLLAKGETLFNERHFPDASVEIAKALVIDPVNEQALKLQKAIREEIAKERGVPVEEKPRVKEAPARKPVPEPKVEVAPAEEVAPKLKFPKQLVWIAAAVILVVVIALLFFQYRSVVFPKKVDLAVLPWTALTQTEGDKAIALALAEEVTKKMEHLKSLKVMGYTSSIGLARYSDQVKSEIYSLGFSYMLQGTLSNDGGRFYIEVNLTDSVGNVQWSQKFASSGDRLYEIPRAVVRKMISATGLELGEGESAFLDRENTANGEAYLSYLHGLALLHEQNVDSTQAALEAFQIAGAQDTKFTDALACAATTLVAMIEGFEASKDTSTTDLAEQLARKAMNSDAISASAHFARGRVAEMKREYPAALREFDLSLVQAPSMSEAHRAKADVYTRAGNYSEALKSLSSAYELNPRDPGLLRMFAQVHQLAGTTGEGFKYHEAALGFVADSTQYLAGPADDALIFDPDLFVGHIGRVTAAFERVLIAAPDNYAAMYRLSRLLQVGGRTAEANGKLQNLERKLRQQLQIHPNDLGATVYLALTLTRLGRFTEANQLAQHAVAAGASNPEILYKVAQVYAVQKKKDAMKVLREAVGLWFSLDAVTSGDFFSVRDQADFRSAIQLMMKQQIVKTE